jgi:short-chain Z-isoprenyl diphosphate synthase
MPDPISTALADLASAFRSTTGRGTRERRFPAFLLQPLYRLYEKRLSVTIRANPLPRHVGIILDGNRRYARKLGITDPRVIYNIGARKLDDVLDWCAEIQIPTVSLWVFSPENLRRSTEEVSGILAAIEAKLTALARDARIHNRRVRVRAIGKLSLVPEPVQVAIKTAEAATAAYDGMVLNIAVGYGGRQEIVDAVTTLLNDSLNARQSLTDAIAALTPEAIGRYLYTAGLPDPDLIIRTSGEVRLSGFMLWQSAHSEFYFTDVHWPAFRKIDFLRAIRTYQSRQRRFGL